jgi:hypothetical protein
MVSSGSRHSIPSLAHMAFVSGGAAASPNLLAVDQTDDSSSERVRSRSYAL